MATMEDQFNKKEDKGCLIGNWVEERALGEHTGERRYYQWEDSIGPEGPKNDLVMDTRWASGGEKADQNDSYRRCFIHRDNQPYDESMKGFSDAIYQDPGKDRPELQFEYRAAPGGMRQSQAEQDMWDEATEEMKADQQYKAENAGSEDPYRTSTMDAQHHPPYEAYQKKLGQRVMQTRDGHQLPNDSRDIQFLVETGIRGPDTQINKTDPFAKQAVVSAAKTDLYNDAAITFYSAPRGVNKIVDLSYGRKNTDNFQRSAQFSTPIECSHLPEKE